MPADLPAAPPADAPAALATPGRAAAPAAALRPAWVLAALALWLLATAGLRPLTLPDEGRYVGVAWGMLASGDWLTPRLHGLPYFHKPPLMYWIDAAGMAVFGPHPAAARLAPVLGAWLMGAAVWFDLRRRAGERAATVALAALATTPMFFIGGQFANLDMLVAGWITLAIVCGARVIEAEPGATGPLPILGWTLATWAAAGFGVLAKGLIGVVLPALVLLPWAVAGGRWRAVLRLLHPAGWLVGGLIALPWFAAMARLHPGFLDYFFLEQHLRRYATTGFNNRQPFWFFLVVLPALALPWTLWLAPAVRRRARASVAAPWALYGWWVAVVVGFFSLPASKLVGYVLPALGPLAALAGLVAARGRAWRWVLPLAALACLVTVGLLARHDRASNREAALALRDRLQPGDQVVLAGGHPFFDLPFYARLPRPPAVLLDWDDPTIPQRDDWRKELADAGRFAPPAAGRLLVRPAEAGRLACGPGRTWVLATPAWTPLPALGPLQEAHRDGRAVLWLVSGRSADCR